jgi:hypothetical protein
VMWAHGGIDTDTGASGSKMTTPFSTPIVAEAAATMAIPAAWTHFSQPAHINYGQASHASATRRLSSSTLTTLRENAQSDWSGRFMQALTRIAALQDGWDSSGAARPTARAIGGAKAALRWMSAHVYQPSYVAPTVEGGVLLSIVRGGMRVDMEFESDGSLFIAPRGLPSASPSEHGELDDAAFETLEGFLGDLTGRPSVPVD